MPFSKQELKNLVASGQIDLALQKSASFAELSGNEGRYNDALALLSRYNGLEEEKHRGTIAEDAFLTELNKIRQAVLALIDKLPEDAATTAQMARQEQPAPKLRQWWKKWEVVLATLAALAGVTGYTFKDFFGGAEKTGSPTSLTVFACDAKKGKQYPILREQGHIWLDINGERKQEAIDDKGKAVFQNLRIGDSVLLEVNFSEPYRALRPDSIYVVPENGQIYLPVELKGLDKIAGTLISKNQPLPGVIVSLGELRDTSDALGRYELNIPDFLQKKEQQVQFFTPGYQLRIETIYPQTGQSWDFVLEKQ